MFAKIYLLSAQLANFPMKAMIPVSLQLQLFTTSARSPHIYIYM